MTNRITDFLIISCLLMAGFACTQQRGPQYESDTRGMMRPETAQRPAELNNLIGDAGNVYQRFFSSKRHELPLDRIRNERACVAVVPKLSSTALLVGMSSGRGIVSCKQAGSGSPWSAPMFFKMSSQSLGAQLGQQTSQVISYVVGPEAGKNFMRGDTFQLGSELGATAGSTSGTAALSSRAGHSYVMNQQGAFLGASLSGSSITPDADANRAYYGDVSPNDILFGQVTTSQDAQRFADLLSRTI